MGRAKSVLLTEEGEQECKRLFRKYFGTEKGAEQLRAAANVVVKLGSVWHRASCALA